MSKWQRGPKLIKTSRLSAQTDIPVGEEFEGLVKGLADTGNGIVEHPGGRIFFVAGAWPGERVRVRVREVKKSFGIASLVQVAQASPARREAPCVHHGFTGLACGGCPWMMVSEQAQQQAKQQRVAQALARIDPKATVSPILAAPAAFGYRVRAQLKTDGQNLGFVATAQKQLAPVQDCIILSDKNRQTLAQLHDTLPNPQWRPQGKLAWTTLDIDEDTDAQSVSVNQRLPFQQANREQNTVMRAWLARKLEGLSERGKALELFAGSGNLTEVLAAAGFDSIVAAEVMPAAVAALNARRLPKVVAEVCDLFDETQFARLVAQHRDANLLLLDPPRDGLKLKQDLLQKRSKLSDILYISCDLPTFARDVSELYQRGFVLHEVQPLDMFAQTPHIEIMAHLRRKAK